LGGGPGIGTVALLAVAAAAAAATLPLLDRIARCLEKVRHLGTRLHKQVGNVHLRGSASYKKYK